MAHSCPECYQACYCGGDIDDCFFEGTKEESHCTHCPIDGIDEDPDYEDEPDRCYCGANVEKGESHSADCPDA